MPTCKLLMRRLLVQAKLHSAAAGCAKRPQMSICLLYASNHQTEEKSEEMKTMSKQGSIVLLAAALAVASFTATAVRAAEPVTTTVTAVGKKNTQPPPIKKDDVELYKGKERLQVADWRKG